MTTPHHTGPEAAAPGKVLAPTVRELARATAENVGACTRPIAVRRIDPATGERRVVGIPCGATRASVCSTCADRARRLRMHQAREGWHRDTEPQITTLEPTTKQRALLEARAHLVGQYRSAVAAENHDQAAELRARIEDLDRQLRGTGLRGSLPAVDAPNAPKRTRSTRRRQDVPDLPRHRVAATTVGRTFTARDGQVFRPSTFLTLTLPSYGRVRPDGTPVDPDTYDYRQAASDALHFASLLDRFWQNLRRAVGWNVQYFATVEPQKRGAAHLHAAVRGTMPRSLVRQVAAATYHQVWWPTHDEPTYAADAPPVWDDQAGGYVDPATGAPLPTWDEALDELDADPDAVPAHVVRFGRHLDVQGVIPDQRQAGECLTYLVKYLTKSTAEIIEPDTTNQAEHYRRLAAELRVTPCSERCANWLLYGIQPKNTRPGLVPGACSSKAHHATTLGYAGRRCLVSRLWSGKTLTEHRTDRRTHVLRTLGAVGARLHLATTDGHADRYQWEPVRPGDPDTPNPIELLMRVINQQRHWRQQYEQAQDQLNRSATTDLAA
jgi:hypothetical protein